MAIDYIQPYLDAGYTGIIVTDHFLNGNTIIAMERTSKLVL